MADHFADVSNMVPRRVQLRRTAGWRMPENTVKVDRTTKWGNPFVPGKPGGVYTAMVMNRRHAWQLFRSVALTTPAMREAAQELRGKNLACWCPLPGPGFDDECHAAVWLELANSTLRCDAAIAPSSLPASDLDGTPTRHHTKETPHA